MIKSNARTLCLVACIGLAAAHARAQLSCNGSLTCSASTPAYSFTNTGSGNGLNVTVTGAGKGLNISHGSGYGLYATTTGGGTSGYFSSALGQAVFASTGSATLAAIHADSYNGHAVDADTGGSGDAIHGVHNAGSGSGHYGVYGESSRNTGVYGKALLAGQYGVYASGNLGASGTKTFVEPHPDDPSKQINYASLEGPEAGTYFRGSIQIVGGVGTVNVPEDFRIVTSEAGLTVHLTPVGALAVVACTKKDLREIVIEASRDIEVDYIVHGVRRAFSDFRPIVENSQFRPERADDLSFVAGLPAESVRRLKANGTINADGEINMETVRRLGWDKQESWSRPKANLN